MIITCVFPTPSLPLVTRDKVLLLKCLSLTCTPTCLPRREPDYSHLSQEMAWNSGRAWALETSPGTRSQHWHLVLVWPWTNLLPSCASVYPTGNWDNNSTYCTLLLWGLNKVILVKWLQEGWHMISVIEMFIWWNQRKKSSFSFPNFSLPDSFQQT